MDKIYFRAYIGCPTVIFIASFLGDAGAAFYPKSCACVEFVMYPGRAQTLV